MSLAGKVDVQGNVTKQEFIRASLNISAQNISSLLPKLVPGEIHIWCLRDEIGDTFWQDFFLILSHQERVKANAFRRQRDRRRFIVRHGMLRILMSHYVGVKPSRLTFTQGKYGKPNLRWPQIDGLNFSLSQTDGVALLSFAYVRAIGIDIEKETEAFDFLTVGSEVFSDQELLTLQECEGASRKRRFFTLWTRKEAYLKALGFGFSIDPRQLTLLDAPQFGTERFQLIQGPSPVHLRGLYDLNIEPGVKAAVAIEQQNTTIKLLRLTHGAKAAPGIFID